MDNYEKLIESLEKEMSEFEDSYKSMSSTQIFNDWYIIGFYTEYYEMLTSGFIEDMAIYFEELEWLSVKDKPLGFLYDKWMSCEGSFSHNWDDMLDWMVGVYKEEKEVLSDVSKESIDEQIKSAKSLSERSVDDKQKSSAICLSGDEI